MSNTATSNQPLPAIYRKRLTYKLLHFAYMALFLITLLGLCSEIPRSIARSGFRFSDLFEALPILLFVAGMAMWGWFCATERIVIESDKIVRHFIWKRPLLFADIRTIFCASVRVVVLSSSEAGHMRLTLCCVTKSGKVWEKFLYPFEAQSEIVERLVQLSGVDDQICSPRELPQLVKQARSISGT